MAGKGSKQRPTDRKKYSDNWDRIFGNKNDHEYESDNPLERPQLKSYSTSVNSAEHVELRQDTE